MTPAAPAYLGVRHKTTSAIAVPIVIAAVAVALLGVTGNSWFLLLAGVAVGALVVGRLSHAHIGGLRVGGEGLSRVASGEQCTAVLTIANAGLRTSSAALVTLTCAGVAEPVVLYVGPLRPRDAAQLPVTFVAGRRGVYVDLTVDVRARASLGLVEATRLGRQGADLIVHPARATYRVSLNASAPDDDLQNVIRGPGSEQMGLRDWQRGDGQRQVHWRATARHGRLVVVEHGQATSEMLRVLMVGPSGSDAFEASLAAAAAACDDALRSGTPLVVAALTPQGLQAGPTGSRTELLDWWAGVTTVLRPDDDNLKALPDVLGGGTVVVAGPEVQALLSTLGRSDLVPMTAVQPEGAR